MMALKDYGWLASAVRSLGMRMVGLVVIIAAVPFGSVMTFPFLLVTVLCLTLTLLAAVLFEEPENTRVAYRIGIAIILLSSAWMFIQTLPQVPVQWQHPAWAMARTYLPEIGGSISLAPGDAALGALALAFPLSLFLFALIVCDTDERARYLIATLGTFGGLAAVFSLAQFLMAPGQLLVITKTSYLDSLTGLFVNRNTAATFFGLAFLINLARLRDELVRFVWRSEPQGLVRQLNLVALVVFTLSTLMALMLTRSRAGIAASGVAALVYIPYLVANWHKLSTRREDRNWRSFLWGAASFILTLLGFLIFGAQAILRMQTLGLAEDGRFCIFPDLVRAAEQNWLTGSGLGAFRLAFAPFRDADCGIRGVFDRAHNAYIEAFMGLGILFPVLLLLALTGIIVCLRAGWRNRRRSRHYSLLGLAGLILVLVHSAFDFSVQIPGFVAYFSAFLAAICSLCTIPIRTAPAVGAWPSAKSGIEFTATGEKRASTM